MLRLKSGVLAAALVLMVAVVAGCPATQPEPVVDPGAAVAVPVPAAATVTTGDTSHGPVPAAPVPVRLPRLVDLGRGTCIPCKMMAPILEQLKTEYAGRATVEFIDITDNMAAAQQYGIRTIPTQIFFDGNGNEISRHEGFLAKEEIVKIFRQMGVQ